MRALLIVNPTAGQRTAKEGDLDRAVALLTGAGFALDRVETAPERPSTADLARRAVSEHYDACIVAGGDGTVQAAAGELLDSDVVLGILPFGTYMNVAHGLGIPLDPIEAAQAIARRQIGRADAGVVHDRPFFEIAGIGLDAELVGAARHAEGKRWRLALRRMWRYATQGTHRVSITIDGDAHTHRVMQILVMNSPYYGWALPLLPDAKMDDGILDIAVFPRMGRIALIRALIELARNKGLPQPPIRYRGTHILMTCEVPLAVHADGTVVGALPAQFVCRKGPLRVFV